MLPFLVLLCVSQWPLLLSAAFNVDHLPGFLHEGSLPFHLETGYVEVDEIHGVELFYYFIESERNPREDPVLLWLTGGPGCSAFSGLSLEIGPLKIRSQMYNGSLPNLVYNPYTWTKISSIIFLDSPIGTGFSFSNHPLGYETGDKSWSKQAVIFLRKWFVDHQQFLANPLYIAGDSYAGKIVPVIVHEILNENELQVQPKLNIQGYMIGNPLTGEVIDVNSRVPFAFGMGLISEELYQVLSYVLVYLWLDSHEISLLICLEQISTSGMYLEVLYGSRCTFLSKLRSNFDQKSSRALISTNSQSN